MGVCVRVNGDVDCVAVFPVTGACTITCLLICAFFFFMLFTNLFVCLSSICSDTQCLSCYLRLLLQLNQAIIDDDGLRKIVTAAAGSSQWLVVWVLVRVLGAPAEPCSDFEAQFKQALEKGDRMSSLNNQTIEGTANPTTATSVQNESNSNVDRCQDKDKEEENEEEDDDDDVYAMVDTNPDGTLVLSSDVDLKELEDVHKTGHVLPVRCCCYPLPCCYPFIAAAQMGFTAIISITTTNNNNCNGDADRCQPDGNNVNVNAFIYTSVCIEDSQKSTGIGLGD